MAQRGNESDTTDEDLPPLEDMTEYVEEVKRLKTRAERTAKPKKVAKSGNQASRATPPKAAPSSFGGLKKGFLSSSSGGRPPAKSKSVSSPGSGGKDRVSKRETGDDLPFIKAKEKKGDSLAMPEVQEALKESAPFLQSQDWVTDDLMSKIENHPTLSRAFRDPRLKDVLSRIHSDPHSVLAAMQAKPELQVFLKDFCEVMGEHFTALAEKEERVGGPTGHAGGQRRAAPLITEVSSQSPEEAKLLEAIEKPEVRAALEDPEIKKLIVILKHDPDKAQRMVQVSSQEFRKKIHVLIDNGILGLQAK